MMLRRGSSGKVPCLSDLVIQGTSWRDAPFAFNHYGLRKGKYLKYCYSIVKELESGIYPLIIFGNEQGVLTGVFCKKILFFFIFMLIAQKTARQFIGFAHKISPAVRQGKGCDYFSMILRSLSRIFCFRLFIVLCERCISFASSRSVLPSK